MCLFSATHHVSIKLVQEDDVARTLSRWVLDPACVVKTHIAASIRGLSRSVFGGCHTPLCRFEREGSSVLDGGSVHLLLCVCDRFAPKHDGAPPAAAARRVTRWAEEFPKQFSRFRDADGRPPRHTFFYAAHDYESEYIDTLASLCREGFGEVEISLPGEDAAGEWLRPTIVDFKEMLHDWHGLLGRDQETGKVTYGLMRNCPSKANARVARRRIVDQHERDVLHETGCYGDFTPSSSARKSRHLHKQVQHPADAPALSRDRLGHVGESHRRDSALLAIPGPRALDWSRRRLGFLPSIDDGCLNERRPASPSRLRNWLRAGVRATARPDWSFVKLYTDGADEANMEVLLGDAMVRFHEGLAAWAERSSGLIQFHYVTAREMANLAIAAQAGWAGDVSGALDHVVGSPFQK
jgi:hypothetical protein